MARAGGAFGLVRALLTLALVLSLTVSGWNGWQLLRGPAGGWLVARAEDRIAQQMNEALSTHATPARITERLDVLLTREPRNWLAIAAVEEVAAERGIVLPQALKERRAALHDADHGMLARSGACLRCTWDATRCGLSTALTCRLPVELSPLGDIAGIARAGVATTNDDAVDKVDLTLSAVGLAATALTPASGGGSLAVKAGAGLGKLMWRTGRLTPAMKEVFRRAARQGVDWSGIAGVRSAGDLAVLVDRGAMRPLLTFAGAAERMRASLGMPATLHMLSRLDTPREATQAARAARALGAQTVGRLEVLGKARFLRATMRMADEVWWAFAALAAAVAALAGLASSTAMTAVLRRLRRSLR